jgi:hypothetical protein
MGEREMKSVTAKVSAVLTLAALAFAANAADHMDSPITKNDPSADINDVYTFVNPNNANELILVVTYVPNANFNSRFSDAVDYRFHFDNGATQSAITCHFSGTSTRVTCNGPNGLAASGTVGHTIQGSKMRLYTGLRDDPFFFDLDAFNATKHDLAPRFTNPGKDFFLGFNTLAIAFAIDKTALTNNGANNVLKIYASTKRTGGAGVGGGFTGAWFDATNPGHGIQLQILPPAAPGLPDNVFATWYTYDNFGAQRWIYGTGTVNGTQIHLDAFTTSGAYFPPAFASSQVTTTPFGTLDFNFTDCNHGTLLFASAAPGFNTGVIPLTRLTQPKDTSCALLVSGQVDRMGRPGINTALIDLLRDSGKKDQYNRAEDPQTWPTLFQSEMQTNLAALDTLDGTTGNTLLPPATAAAVLVDDRLVIDVSKSTCDAYLAVEVGANQCGGRTLRRDVIDDTLGAIVGPGVSDNVSFDSTLLQDFPFLGDPN